MAENRFDNIVKGYSGFLDNEYVSAGLSLFLILYAGVIAPKLSPNVITYFDNIFVKLLMFFFIVYLSKKNATVALIASVAVLVTLMIANNQNALKAMIDAEKFESCQSNLMQQDGSFDPHHDDMLQEPLQREKSNEIVAINEDDQTVNGDDQSVDGESMQFLHDNEVHADLANNGMMETVNNVADSVVQENNVDEEHEAYVEDEH